jgi:hypothetical protein
MTIVQNCNRLEHFIDLQDDYANLQNHLEYLVDLQDDSANLQNHLEYLIDLQDDSANLQNHLEMHNRPAIGGLTVVTLPLAKVYKQSPLHVNIIQLRVYDGL